MLFNSHTSFGMFTTLRTHILVEVYQFMMTRILAAAALVVLPALSACQTTGQQPGIEPMTASDPRSPPNAKAAILAVKNTLWRTEDIISAAITPPRPGIGQWSVCVRIGSKFRFGDGLILNQYVIAIYDDGKPPAIVAVNLKLQCGYPPYEPFPELENGYKPPTPAKGT